MLENKFIRTPMRRFLAVILKAKQFLQSRGVQVAGGITIIVSVMNRFQPYCYSNPEHTKKLREIVEYTAEIFDEIIFGDFFLANCKCEYCIRAKGLLGRGNGPI
jgi:hypothetical protein